jgi:hypothetical protein
MIIYPKKRCSECKKFATSVYRNTFYCEDHRTVEAIDLDNSCTLCMGVYVQKRGEMCSGCQEYSKENKTTKRNQKELKIRSLLEENKIEAELYDKIVKGGCSAKRPDVVIPTEWGSIVLEIDENQHNRKNYTCECEISRMKKIYFDIGTQYLLYIRYNPDKYTPSYGKEFSELKRHEYLIKKIQRYLSKRPENACTVIYLFYDGFTHCEIV